MSHPYRASWRGRQRKDRSRSSFENLPDLLAAEAESGERPTFLSSEEVARLLFSASPPALGPARSRESGEVEGGEQ